MFTSPEEDRVFLVSLYRFCPAVYFELETEGNVKAYLNPTLEQLLIKSLFNRIKRFINI